MNGTVPPVIRTPRLLLRSWGPADAPALEPMLVANVARLGGWIPAHVADPLPAHALAQRLTGFATDFAEDRAYRYAILTPDGAQLLGEADLFPRGAAGRMPLFLADRAEIGYWLDAAATGQGYATEAAGALSDVTASLPGMLHVEIRCAEANAASAAVPRRLGFRLVGVEEGSQVWVRRVGG